MSMTIDIVTARLDVAHEEECAARAILSQSENERAARFVFSSDRRRFVVARGTLRRLLGARLDARPQSIDIVYQSQGKPALGPRFAASGLRFNVAHCDDVAVYAFSFDSEVGVDVEAVRWFADADDVATRFFSPAENDAFAALEPAWRPIGFFNCWTRKEAFVKAMGTGLVHPLQSFDVSLAPNEAARILRVGKTPGQRCGWDVSSFVPALGYVGAMVTRQA